MVVKDKCDSKGELLLWKYRFCTGGHDTDPTTYQPFDKTSPTASMDAVYMVLILAQRLRMNVEVCDVPSAYLNNTPLSKGNKEAPDKDQAPSRKVFLQSGQFRQGIPAHGRIPFGPLEKVLYGLSEAGKLWHELLRDNLKAAGYIHKPNDTTFWRRIEQDCEGRTTAMSIILVFVDDFLHAWWTKSGSSAM